MTTVISNDLGRPFSSPMPSTRSNGVATRGNSAPPSMCHNSPTGNHGHGHGHSHLGITKLGNKSVVGNLRSLLVILALSFHAVFEVRSKVNNSSEICMNNNYYL